MNEILQYAILTIVAIVIVNSLGFLKIGYLYKDFRTYFIRSLPLTLGIMLIIVIFKFIPKHEVGIDFIIDNKSKYAEITINEKYFSIDQIESIKNIQINSSSGFIAVKGNNVVKLIQFRNEKSITSKNKKVNIIIFDNEIIVKGNIIFTVMTDNYDNFDGILNIYKKNH
jgi:hypothetical protein